MIKYFLSFIVCLLSLAMMQYYNNHESNINNNNGLNCWDENINFTKIEESKQSIIEYEDLSHNEQQFIDDNLEEMVKLQKKIFTKNMEKNGCDKGHSLKNHEDYTVFFCFNGMLYKTIYDDKLIKKRNGSKITTKVSDLIIKFGWQNNYKMLNEYTGINIIEEDMRKAVSGWEVAMKLLNGIQIDSDENRKHFDELKNLNVVQTINSITYPDFSVLSDNKNEYLLVTYVEFENCDEQTWNIDHKLEKAK